LHWPNPPYPIEDPSPRLTLFVALFAVALIFVVVALYATKSGPLPHERDPQTDESGSEEKET